MLSGKAGKTMAFLMAFAMVATVIAVFPANNVSGADGDIYYITGTLIDDVTNDFINKVTVTVDNGAINKTIETGSNGHFNISVDDETVDFDIYFSKIGYYSASGVVTSASFSNGVSNYDKLLVPKPMVSGMVMIDGTELPLYEVDVTIVDSMGIIYETSTGMNGEFSQFVNNGDIEITYEKFGYYYLADSITVTGNVDDIVVNMEKIDPEPSILVWGIVEDADEYVEGALVSVSTGDDKWISDITNANGKYEMLVYPGTFTVKATCEGWLTYESVGWLTVTTDTEQWDIMMTENAPENFWLNGTINNGVAEEATVYLYNADGTYINSVTTVGGDYNITHYDSSFTLVVEQDGFFTEVYGAAIDKTTAYVNIDLTAIDSQHMLSGYVTDAVSNNWIEGADVALYDTTELYTDMTTTTTDGYYEFMVHNISNYVLVVDADGYQADAIDIPALTGDVRQQVELAPAGVDTTKITYTFDDWGNVDVMETIMTEVDNVTLRSNADRKWGMEPLGLHVNDWILDSGEIDSWQTYLENKGIGSKDTMQTFTIDGIYYDINDDTFSVSIEGADGEDITTASGIIYINKTYNYTISDSTLLADDSVGHTLFFGAAYDSETMDRVYEIYLPEGFEMTSGETETTDVELTGYNDPITIDTAGSVELLEEIVLTLESSEAGTAVAFVSGGLFYELNSSADGYDVIVSAPQDGVSTEVTFTAEDSTDPVGDIEAANFTWDFGNGDMAYGMTTVYNYTAADDYDVTLSIVETGGDTTNVPFNVKADGTAPVSEISVNTTDDNVTLTGTTLTVNQGRTITFDGLTSYDDVKAGDKLGVIESWFWVWGDDSVNETITMNEDNSIDKVYSTPGTYTIQMTTTDVVGHESVAAELDVIVQDTAAPLIMNILMFDEDSTEVNDAVQNTMVYFSANETSDADDFENLVFSWDFDDDGVEDANGSWVSTTFDEIGDVNVTLTATDSAGNSNDLVRVVNVRIGESANLLLMAATFNFDPETGTKGDTTTITVNITNNGALNATNVAVDFYIRDSDGVDTKISGTASLKIDGVSVTTIAPGEIATASIAWKPANKGTYTIWANVTTDSEHVSQYTDNNNIGFFEYSTYTVEESDILIYIIIAVVVLGGIGAFVGTKFIMNRKGSEPKTGDKKKRK